MANTRNTKRRELISALPHTHSAAPQRTPTSPTHRRILWVQAFGFLLIIVMSWLDETIMLPEHIFGGWIDLNGWHESVWETFVIVCVAVPIIAFTSRLLTRLHYIENFIRVCAWCKKIDLDGKWVPMEQYFDARSNLEFTHAICRSCSRTQIESKLPRRGSSSIQQQQF